MLKRAVGPGSSAQKYDVLTMLGVHALGQSKTVQRQALRLICLITARYNWKNDQLSVGQAEIAKLWSVDVRTVKREMAALRKRGWLVEKRPAARGRVALYGLGLTQIQSDTRPSWRNVGEDLVERLATPKSASEPKPLENVIPFPTLPEGEGVWARMTQELCREDPNVYRTWFAPLTCEESHDAIELTCPTRFHASYLKSHYQGRLVQLLSDIAPGVALRIE